MDSYPSPFSVLFELRLDYYILSLNIWDIISIISAERASSDASNQSQYRWSHRLLRWRSDRCRFTLWLSRCASIASVIWFRCCTILAYGVSRWLRCRFCARGGLSDVGSRCRRGKNPVWCSTQWCSSRGGKTLSTLRLLSPNVRSHRKLGSSLRLRAHRRFKGRQFWVHTAFHWRDPPQETAYFRKSQCCWFRRSA